MCLQSGRELCEFFFQSRPELVKGLLLLLFPGRQRAVDDIHFLSQRSSGRHVLSFDSSESEKLLRVFAGVSLLSGPILLYLRRELIDGGAKAVQLLLREVSVGL
jgi:hypothetical protein